jgi:hypothetical protein
VADGDEPLRLGGEGERLSVSLAVLEQLLLVALKKLEGEVAPFPLTRWGYAAAASVGVCWVMFSYSIGLR